MATTYQRKTCRDCGGRDEVIDGLCGSCACRYTYCSICDVEIAHESDGCRHLFWENDYCEFIGPGNYRDDMEEDFATSLMAMLDKTGMADELIHTILYGEFVLRFCGGMLGYHGIDCYLRDGVTEEFYNFGDALTNNLTDEQEEEMSMAVRWLNCLYKEDSGIANRKTVQWIRAWKAAQTQPALQEALA